MQDWAPVVAVGAVLVSILVVPVLSRKARSIPKASSAKTLVLFSNDIADFCKGLKSWTNFVHNMEGHMLYNNLQILQPLPQEFSQFDNPPERLPAVRLYPNGLEGNYVDFQGEITLNNLINFVQANYDPNQVPIQRTKIIAPRH